MALGLRFITHLDQDKAAEKLGGWGWPHIWPEGCGSALPVWCPDRRLSFCQFPFLSLMLSPKAKPCPEPNPVVVQFRVHMSHLVASCW